jgi:hypothetical protein
MGRLQWILALAFLNIAFTAHGASTSLSAGQTLDLGAASGDPAPDGVADIDAFVCNCPPNMAFHILNGARYGFPLAASYAAMSFAEAQSRPYQGSDGDGYAPEAGDLFYVRTGASPNGRYYKMRISANGGGALGIEYAWLGTGDPAPPQSSYTFDTYDLWANFSETSTGGATSWSWQQCPASICECRELQRLSDRSERCRSGRDTILHDCGRGDGSRRFGVREWLSGA